MAPDTGISPSARRVVFVYYKVEGSRVALLKSAFAAAGTAPFAARVELLRRAGAPPDAAAVGSDEATWMEIYWLLQSPVDHTKSWDVAAACRQIEAWAAAAGLAGHIRGQRHYEAFETCV